MRYERYEFEASEFYTSFVFHSEGRNGIYKILVSFRPITPVLYHMGFAVCMVDGKMDDLQVINNGDTTKILATVAETADYFLTSYPGISIVFKGSSPSRTRLYQKGISQNFEELSQKFLIFGLCERGWIQFESGTNFESFSVKQKPIAS